MANDQSVPRRRPSPAQYDLMKTELALEYTPRIYPCVECGWPVITGYCCTMCGSGNPSGS